MQTSGLQHATLAGAAPTSTRAGIESLSLRTLAELYLAQYSGRDRARPKILAWWIEQLGNQCPYYQVIDDDVILAALDALRGAQARVYAGLDANRQPVYRARGGKLSPATINRYHAALMALFTWAIKRRLAPRGWENPAHLVETQPENNQVVRFLTEEERARLLEACRRSSWERLYCLVLMAITTGARRGELLSLTWGAIDLERGLAHVQETKNGEPRVLPLTPAVVAELTPWKLDRPDARVFPAKGPRGLFKPRHFEKAWYTALREARINNFRFHDARHTCASYLAQSGASLLEIADVLGHRQLRMVQRYAHHTTASKAKLVNRVLGGIQ